ncbi:hypothetical protein C8R44DRAFT_824723 [Mycena epipterygia]|nr:hypothetical protein C8R44DRAFT_824723 [Mycena epipterygia]
MTDSAHAHPQPQETTCPPKMRKRWNEAGRGRVCTRGKMGSKTTGSGRRAADDGQGFPGEKDERGEGERERGGRQDKGKSRAHALPLPQHGLDRQTHVVETGLHLPVQTLFEGTSPSASFARLSLVSPHPGAGDARLAWFAPGGADVNVDVLPHEPPIPPARRCGARTRGSRRGSHTRYGRGRRSAAHHCEPRAPSAFRRAAARRSSWQARAAARAGVRQCAARGCGRGEAVPTISRTKARAPRSRQTASTQRRRRLRRARWRRRTEWRLQGENMSYMPSRLRLCRTVWGGKHGGRCGIVA